MYALHNRIHLRPSDSTGRVRLTALSFSDVEPVPYINLLAGGVLGQKRFEGGVGQDYYYLKDHLGSTRVILRDNNGTTEVTATNDFYPFGKILRTGGLSGDVNKFKFSGKERDSESGWDYFGARLYDSEIGIFRSLDRYADKYPSLNPYQYAANNPIVFIDIDGDYLEVGGNQSKSLDYIKSMLDSDTAKRLSVDSKGQVILDLKGFDWRKRGSDAGFQLVYNLVKSKNKYLFEVLDKGKTSEGRDRKTKAKETLDEMGVGKSGIWNLSKTERNAGNPYWGGSGDLPKKGYDGQLVLGPGHWESLSTDPKNPGLRVPTDNVVFHELSENYYRTEKGEPYERITGPDKGTGAHPRAIYEARFYSKQSPFFKPGAAKYVP